MSPKAYSYIRFSTPEQLKGDSLRRQLQASEDYCRKNGIELDTTLSMRDLGISAFRGQHRTKGALSEFLKLIELGKIPTGSILIIESLDRLSREQTLDALSLFTQIIQAGIRVVTLSDNREYTTDSINRDSLQLIMSLMVLSRAHEESETKSKRLKEAWEHKRSIVGDRKLTARAPAWLKLAKDKKTFIPIPDRCKAIEFIFDMKLQAKGTATIARDLNTMDIWAPAHGWRKSYINKILRNRSVIGEYQPHRKIDGKRQPTMDAISDYYPTIIEEAKFLKCQNLLKQNRHFGGKNGNISNLFGHIAKCGYCGAPMRLIHKGKGGTYYVCDNGNRGLHCHKVPIRYDKIEEVLLTYCRGLQVTDILQGDEHASQLQQLQDEIVVTRARLDNLNGDIDNLIQRVQATRHPEVATVLETRLNELLKDRDLMTADEQRLHKQIDEETRLADTIQDSIDSVKDLINRMKDLDIEARIDLRLKLRDRIRSLIDNIKVYPLGQQVITEAYIEQAMVDLSLCCSENELTQAREQLQAMIDNRQLLTLKVHFKTGSFRIIQPFKTEPLIIDFDRENKMLYYS